MQALDLASYEVEHLWKEPLLVLIMSTYENGSPPDSARSAQYITVLHILPLLHVFLHVDKGPLQVSSTAATSHFSLLDLPHLSLPGYHDAVAWLGGSANGWRRVLQTSEWAQKP
jgi:hypothetical protein